MLMVEGLALQTLEVYVVYVQLTDQAEDSLSNNIRWILMVSSNTGQRHASSWQQIALPKAGLLGTKTRFHRDGPGRKTLFDASC